jgi:hypothetical protein
MSAFKALIETWGIWWDITVIMLAIIATFVWLDLVVGNKIRTKATSLIGIWTETVMNRYVKTKKIMKAKSLHAAFGRKYAVVNLAGRYFVVGKYQRHHMNRILKKYHSKLTYKKAMENAVFWTK